MLFRQIYSRYYKNKRYIYILYILYHIYIYLDMYMDACVLHIYFIYRHTYKHYFNIYQIYVNI